VPPKSVLSDACMFESGLPSMTAEALVEAELDRKKKVLRKRNALYARRKYARRKVETQSLQGQCRELEEKNRVLKLEQARLENLVSQAIQVVSICDSFQGQTSPTYIPPVPPVSTQATSSNAPQNIFEAQNSIPTAPTLLPSGNTLVPSQNQDLATILSMITTTAQGRLPALQNAHAQHVGAQLAQNAQHIQGTRVAMAPRENENAQLVALLNQITGARSTHPTPLAGLPSHVQPQHGVPQAAAGSAIDPSLVPRLLGLLGSLQSQNQATAAPQAAPDLTSHALSIAQNDILSQLGQQRTGSSLGSAGQQSQDAQAVYSLLNSIIDSARRSG